MNLVSSFFACDERCGHMLDRGVSTSCIVSSTPLSSNARVDAVRSEPRQKGGGRSGGSLGLGCLAAGRPLHPICPRSVQGKWELEGDNRRFRPGGAAGAQPRTDNGGSTRGAAGSFRGSPDNGRDKKPLRLPVDHKQAGGLRHKRDSLPEPLSPVAPNNQQLNNPTTCPSARQSSSNGLPHTRGRGSSSPTPGR